MRSIGLLIRLLITYMYTVGDGRAAQRNAVVVWPLLLGVASAPPHDVISHAPAGHLRATDGRRPGLPRKLDSKYVHLQNIIIILIVEFLMYTLLIFGFNSCNEVACGNSCVSRYDAKNSHRGKK